MYVSYINTYTCIHMYMYMLYACHPQPLDDTSAYVRMRQHTSAYVRMRHHKSAYVSIHMHMYMLYACHPQPLVACKRQ